MNWTKDRLTNTERQKTDVLPEQYNVKEIGNPSYFERLEKNIIDSEGTVILTYGQLIRGSNATRELANTHNKPCLLLELNEYTLNHAISSIRKWMAKHEIDEIFFTGSKPIAAPNLRKDVIQIIESIYQVPLKV